MKPDSLSCVEAALVTAGGICGSQVHNAAGDSLGTISELMIDSCSGRVAYVVLAFGGVLGVGEKLFAVPWDALQIDALNSHMIIDIARERLQDSQGFDKDAWPTDADARWRRLTGEPSGDRMADQKI